MTRCSCDPVYYSGGKPHPDVGGHDPNCPTHGYPNDEWRAGSPLLHYRGYVDKRTGEFFDWLDAHAEFPRNEEHAIDGMAFQRRFRVERPREVTRRLLRELNWGPLPKLKPLRRCPVRFGQR